MRVLIDRFEVRVAGADERARGERVAGLVRGRLDAALERRAATARTGSPDGPTPAPADATAAAVPAPSHGEGGRQHGS